MRPGNQIERRLKTLEVSLENMKMDRDPQEETKEMIREVKTKIDMLKWVLYPNMEERK